jgi:hypothetical protein
MHPGRQTAIVHLSCLAAMTVVFALLWFVVRGSVFAVCFALFFLGTCDGCYRVFCFSDGWYRAQERKRAEWYARHPRLSATLTVLGFLVAGLLLLLL